jgi:transcription initiation factor TFIIH subunit 2
VVDLAVAQLRHCPSHVSRELLIVWSSLASCDPGDLFGASMQEALAAGIRISVVHLSAQMRACYRLSELTEGVHGVMIDKDHFRSLLAARVQPPLDTRTSHVALIPTGMKNFPHIYFTNQKGFPVPNAESSVLCSCHRRLNAVSFSCPSCVSFVCELPSSCPICGLHLVAASHLARSFRHLKPVPSVESRPPLSRAHCLGCQAFLPAAVPTPHCKACKAPFCIACSSYNHNSLFNCPGCVRTIS